MHRRFLLLAGVFVAACGQPSATPTPSPAVARVGDTVITEHQVDVRLQSTLAALAGGGAPASDPAMTARVRASIIRGLIFDTVIAQEAAYRGVAATESDIASAIAQAESDAGGHDQLETQLAAAGESDESLRDETVSRLNEQHLEDFFAKDRAATVLQALASGQSFAALATQYSDSPDTAKAGGALGTLSDGDISAKLGGAVLPAVRSLAAGSWTRSAVRTSSGYEIVRVDGITPAGRSLSEILIAAPDPYTVRERPVWFGAQVFQAILDDCQAHRITVMDSDPGADPCAAPPSPSPSASARASASP